MSQVTCLSFYLIIFLKFWMYNPVTALLLWSLLVLVTYHSQFSPIYFTYSYICTHLIIAYHLISNTKEKYCKRRARALYQSNNSTIEHILSILYDRLKMSRKQPEAFHQKTIRMLFKVGRITAENHKTDRRTRLHGTHDSSPPIEMLIAVKQHILSAQQLEVENWSPLHTRVPDKKSII